MQKHSKSKTTAKINQLDKPPSERMDGVNIAYISHGKTEEAP